MIYKDNASTDPPLNIIVLEEIFWNFSLPECASHELDMLSETVSTNRKHLTAKVESCNTDRSVVLLHSDRSVSTTLPPSVRTHFMETEERQNFKCQSDIMQRYFSMDSEISLEKT
jgi:hypothetical protein